MYVLLEFEVPRICCFSASARRLRCEDVLCAGTKAVAVPRKSKLFNRRVNSVRPSRAKYDHGFKCLWREHFGERGSHSGQRECVSRQGPADSAGVNLVQSNASRDGSSHFVSHTESSSWDSAGDGLADSEEIRFKSQRGRHSARAHRNCVRFINDPESPVLLGQLTYSLKVAIFWQHNPHVGHGRLHQDRRHVSMRESFLHRR